MTKTIKRHAAGEPLPSADWNDVALSVEQTYPNSAREVIIGTGPSTAPVRHNWPTVDVTYPPFNAAGDGTTDDTTAIQGAATAAAGLTLFFPKPASYFKITGPIAISANTTIVLDPGAIIEQVTKYKPVFDVLAADGVSVRGNGALLRYTGSRTFTAGTTTRGDAEYGYAAGVWSNGNRTVVRDLRVEGLTAGVHFSGWNGTALTDYAHDSNVVDNIRVDTVDFGLLCTGQSDLTVRAIRGKTVLSPTSTNPDHLIYVSHGARNRQIVVSDCEAWDGGSTAYQFKGVDGGTVKNLAARNCAGLMSLATGTGDNNNDLAFSNIHGRSMASSGGNGCLFMGANNTRVRIDGLSIHQSTSDRAIRLDGVDCALSNVTIRARHDTSVGDYDVYVLGTRNTIDGISILNMQDNGTDYTTGWRGILFSTCTDCVVRPLTIRNAYQYGVDVGATATNPTLNLGNAKITLVATGAITKVNTSSTTSHTITGDNLVSTDNGDAAKTLTVHVDDTTQRWNTPLTAARAVTLSTTGAYRGAKFRIVREAGATGAFNLNIGTGPLKALAAASTWAEVEYDGTAWRLTANGSL
jgi:hypothetical protein